jgi:demethylmenaquinone methyltransferase/2-methoxy-6-polyprenyl-1,4-benzoquinol methylase
MGTPLTPYGADAGGSKREQVAHMFDQIAPKYDFLNHFFSLGIDVLWRKKAVRMLRKERPRRIMDMATGTADFALETRRILGDTVHVTGVDISPGMLEIGRKKVARKQWTDCIELVVGDSVSLPYEEGAFDAYTVAFGVRNFEDLAGGLREMSRVLKPGGLGIILEFSRPRKFPMKQLFGFYFRHIMPTVGRWVSKDSQAYRYLPESVAIFPEGDDFIAILRENGYVDIQATPVTGGIATIYQARKPLAR